jgi:hypothetical protein
MAQIRIPRQPVFAPSTDTRTLGEAVSQRSTQIEVRSASSGPAGQQQAQVISDESEEGYQRALSQKPDGGLDERQRQAAVSSSGG